MSKFSRILEMCKKSNDIIAIYRWNDDSEIFIVGKVVSVSKEFYILANIDKYGKTDGFGFQRLDNIARIEADSQYIEMIKKAYTFTKMEETVSSSNNLMDELFENLVTTSTTCTIELEDCDIEFSGRVIKNEKDLVHFNQLDIYGKNDGTLIFEKECVLCIRWNTKDELLLNLL